MDVPIHRTDVSAADEVLTKESESAAVVAEPKSYEYHFEREAADKWPAVSGELSELTRLYLLVRAGQALQMQ